MDDLARWEQLKARVPQGYEPIGTLGSGGGATVLHARSMRFSSDVAMKIAHGDEDPEVYRLKIEAIVREARALQRLTGVPGVISFVACEHSSDEPVLVMERIRGYSLQQMFQRGAFTLERSLQLLARLADVLAAVHRRGVIHRDVKPDNVLVVQASHGARPILIDFGLATFVEESSVWSGSRRISGSPNYMAPEAFDPMLPHGFGLDVYALGIMLFEICTGRHPFSAENIVELYYRHHATPVPALRDLRPQAHYPERLEHLVRAALEKSQALRLNDVAVFARELREAIMELGPVGGLPLPILAPRRIDLGPTQLSRPQPFLR